MLFRSVAATNAAARDQGQSANALVRALGPVLGGRGGGKDDVAQGGGTEVARVDEALALVRAEVATAGAETSATQG